mgnify:FL=1
MLLRINSKWGIMSIDMQQAVEKDMTAINTDGTYEYVDNEEDTIIEQEESKDEVVEVQNENTEKEVSMNEL